jgi:Chaperone of endosialidase
MSSVNLPASLYDMFQSINDRINRLELGYNGPQASADAAQGTAVGAQVLSLQSYSVATAAQIQAINAGIQANLAASQATVAQSQATIASSQATQAQTSANGKNTILYGTSATPPSGTYKQGDIYYQYDGSNHIKANLQYNGSSWQVAPFTQGTFTALDAGSITTGILNAIEINAGSGSTYFHVTPTGIMTAQGVNVRGSITADSGTFNGSIYSQTGYFGDSTNHWSIGASGLTGVGTATITGGLIQGSSIAVPNSSSYNFAVDYSGNMQAYAGVIGGFSIQTNYLQYGSTWLNAAGGNTAGSYCIYDGSRGIYLGGTANVNTLVVNSNYGITSGGSLTAASANFGSGNIGAGGATFSGTVTANILSTGGGSYYLNNSGALYVGGAEVTGNLQVDSLSSVTYNSTNYNIGLFGTGNGGTQAGRMYKTTSVSSKRFKHNIQSFVERDYLNIVSKLNPVTFNYNPDIVDNPEVTAYGLIAEDVQEIPQTEDLVNIGADGLPESIAYDRLQWYVIKSISQLNDRLTKLEGK